MTSDSESRPSEPVAAVRDLHLSFDTAHGRVRALRGVSLDLHPGEVLALVGESGSGKSVLSSCLLGLPPESRRTTINGSVTVAGVDMLLGASAQRRSVRQRLLGAVFQDPLTSLDPTMRIGTQLTERGVSRARALRNLSQAGVSEPRRVRQWPHELSGGLRQRVMLAMALGADGKLSGPGVDAVFDEEGSPVLIVADEPTTALDVSVQAQVLLLFDQLRRKHGCALLLVTHDLGVAASIADRIAVLYAGRLCEVGSARDILTDPRHPYTAGLLHARLELDEALVPVPISGAPPDPLRLPEGCAFAARCEHSTSVCGDSLPELRSDRSGRDFACVNPLAPAPGRAVGKAPAAVGLVAEQPGSRAEPVLRIDDVHKSYRIPGSRRDRLHAVAGVSLSVPEGGSLAIVGESGCGKTTLLRMACGLLEPDRGSVHWTDGLRPQLIFQDAGSSLTPWLSIGAQVAERLRGEGSRRARRHAAAELLERVGLDRRAARSLPRQLSGGQRQRAAIARALASAPRLLVCDEPVSALDASLSLRILEMLAEIRDELKVAILMVTHDLAAARHVADEVLVMYLGRVVEAAPASQLFRDPRHPYTRGLRAASPTREPGRLAPTLQGEPPSAVGETVGCAFAGRCPDVEPSCRERPQILEVFGDDPRRQVACQVAVRAVPA